MQHINDPAPTPVYIANPSPFRLVLRDNHDILPVSMEEKTYGVYRPLKLHRATRFFDAHLRAPYPLCVGYDGSLIMPAAEVYGDRDVVLEEFNRVCASLLIGGVYVDAVSPSDLSHGVMTMYGYFRHTVPFGPRAEFHQSLGIGPGFLGSLQKLTLIDPATILVEEYLSAYQNGHNVLQQVPTLAPELLVSAFSHHRSGLQREALSHGWTCIEQVLSGIWVRDIVDERLRQSGDMNSSFIQSRQWTAAHKLETLLIRNVIEIGLYQKLYEARQARNGLVHRGEAPTRATVSAALYALIGLLEVAAQTHFEAVNLTRHLDQAPAISPPIVAQAKDIDWSQPLHYITVDPIPGEASWNGEFESHDDITLHRLKMAKKSSNHESTDGAT